MQLVKPIATLITILFFVFSATSFGQSKTYYHPNTFDRTFTKCQNPPTFGTDSLALQKYLANQIHDQISKTEGQTKISVLIDTTGKPLCEWIENNSNFNMDKDKLDLLIDSMPNWNCGVQNGYKVDCVELITLIFNNQDLQVTYRIGKE